VASNSTMDTAVKIGVKYCGGCNPGYDRVAVVKQIEESLGGEVEFVSAESEGVALVLAVEGCTTACADLSAFQGLEIRKITNIEDAEKFMKEMRTRQEKSAGSVK
jgi:hypothetical protein